MNQLYKLLENLMIKDPKPVFSLERKDGTVAYPPVSEYVFPSYEKNLEEIKQIFHFDMSADIKIREFTTGGKKAFTVFIESMVDSDIMNTNILAPLMLIENDASEEVIMNKLIVANQVDVFNKMADVIYNVSMGDCAVFVDSLPCAFVCDVKRWAQRGIEPPVTEAVIYGPHEGFTENYKTNGALIRKSVRNPDLICENLKVGKVSKTPCSVLYMKNIANESLCNEVKRRINLIAADYIFQLQELEQFIEDKTFALTPQFLTTERPDKACSALIEGKVVILLQGSPFALICPVTVTEFMATVEDKYIRFPFANLIRTIRLLGILFSFLLPGMYISIINFHREMIPTDLLFAIEASREAVPFPAFVELLIMEISFDIIREASIRIPSQIGSTLGIIGALIIGQSAVEAGIVSPIAIIIVSLTGIGSFATPNYALNTSFRILRYVYLILGALYGFYGIALCMFIHCLILSGTYSMGVPLISSVANDRNESIFRFLFSFPIWKRETRHNFSLPKQKKVQDPISRRWLKDELQNKDK